MRENTTRHVGSCQGRNCHQNTWDLVWIEKLESAPSPAQAARGQQEAIETVRRVMATNQPHLALVENPFGPNLMSKDKLQASHWKIYLEKDGKPGLSKEPGSANISMEEMC